jgi:hypothetical protein
MGHVHAANDHIFTTALPVSYRHCSGVQTGKFVSGAGVALIACNAWTSELLRSTSGHCSVAPSGRDCQESEKSEMAASVQI